MFGSMILFRTESSTANCLDDLRHARTDTFCFSTFGFVFIYPIHMQQQNKTHENILYNVFRIYFQCFLLFSVWFCGSIASFVAQRYIFCLRNYDAIQYTDSRHAGQLSTQYSTPHCILTFHVIGIQTRKINNTLIQM